MKKNEINNNEKKLKPNAEESKTSAEKEKPNNEPKVRTTIVPFPNFVAQTTKVFKTLKLSSKEKQIIFGSLLGDLYGQTINKGKTYRLRVQQTFDKHKNYALHLFEVFQKWCKDTPRKVERFDQKTTDLRFQTRGHTEFVEFGEMFYKTGEKRLPLYDVIYQRLTPIALAYWFMDDGGIDGANPRGCVFYTYKFSFEEVERLVDIFFLKYQLQAKSRMHKDKKIIVISAKSCETFNALVFDFIIPSMYYKVPGYKNGYKPSINFDMKTGTYFRFNAKTGTKSKYIPETNYD